MARWSSSDGGGIGPSGEDGRRNRPPGIKPASRGPPAVQTSRVRVDASDATVLDLIELIYDAALDPGLWSRFLHRYADAIGASCANTHARMMPDGDFFFMDAARIDPATLQSFMDHYAPLEPWLPPARRMPVGTAATSPMLVEDAVLENSEYYSDFLAPADIRHISCLVVMNDPATFAVVSAFRPKRKSDFGAEEQALARRLWPHLQRAIQIRKQVMAADGRWRSLAEALDSLPTGVFLLDRYGQILHANRAAEAILAEGDGLSAGLQGLEASLAGESRGLQVLIANTACAEDAGQLIAISRPSGKRPYQVLATPIRVPQSAAGFFATAAAVFVTDPERLPELPRESLRRVYGLTPSEADLAAKLASGMSLDKAAEDIGVTRETVRSRLKIIFAKTDTHRQAELIRLLLTLPNAVK